MKKSMIIILLVSISFTVTANINELTQAEQESILLMREEEKLARDVYTALYATWGIPIFKNIAQSEQIHMDEIGFLIKNYGLTDPVSNDIPGVFRNKELWELYKELVIEGGKDFISALNTGALIEDLDISDLKILLSQTNKNDIRIVYLNLEKGSRNHLRSFYYQLARNGADYSPQFISPEYYNGIITTEKETGMEILNPYYDF